MYEGGKTGIYSPSCSSSESMLMHPLLRKGWFSPTPNKIPYIFVLLAKRAPHFPINLLLEPRTVEIDLQQLDSIMLYGKQ